MQDLLIEKIIEKLFGEKQTEVEKKNTHPYLGKYVLMRGYTAGVRAGILADATPGAIILKEARMLRYRWATEGTGLSGITNSGLRVNKSSDIEINAEQKEVMITDDRVSTFFPLSKKVEKQIREREVK